ncbi:hypothetical protein LTS08_003475 [Lithohypha guttulata]|nr:hypothetical protein LTS08_003475 [Lithohypha guttulata]
MQLHPSKGSAQMVRDERSTDARQSSNRSSQELKEPKSIRESSESAAPSTAKSAVIIAGLFLVMFLIALDRLIIGVAIPSITDQFHSLEDIGWYGSAYLLTSSAFMLFMGRIYTFYNPKWVYLGSLVVFEIGSAVCGAAPNSNALIIGRAIAGLGNAGLFQGAVVIIVYIIPLHQRSLIMGLGGAVFGVASVIGPLLGGAFTDGPGWRWCFYINLPCGGAVFVLLVLFLHIPKEMLNRKPTTAREKVARLDPIGTLFFLPGITCLLLALQWGGVTYPWSESRIIALLCSSAILIVAFAIVQWWKSDNATVPKHIATRRGIMAGAWFALFSEGATTVLTYFLPIWFQAIKGASAVHSGIMNLPLVLGIVVTSILAGIATKRIGYFTQWMILSSAIMPIGAGMISTFTPATGHSAWIGYQALYGLGAGLGMQQTSLAAQTILPRQDVATGVALMLFFRTLGGAIFISVGNNVFVSRLAHSLLELTGPNVGSVANMGATDLRQMISATLLPQVLTAYNDALRATFNLATAISCLTVFGAVFMEWKSVKQGADADEAKNEKTEV